MRKAQISSQVFVYILAAIVVGLIVIVGYSAINTLIKTGKDNALQNFKTNFISDVSETADNYDRQKKVILPIPDEYEKICFADSLDEDTKAFSQSVVTNYRLDDYPLIKNSIENGNPENAFLIKGNIPVVSFIVESLDIEKNFICLENQGQVAVWLKGTGTAALLYTE